MVDEVTSRLARQRPKQALAPDARDKILAALTGAIDPMGATSLAVSHVNPEAAQWMQDIQTGNPGMANVGAMLTGGAALQAFPRTIGAALGVGGGLSLNAPEADAQRSKAAVKRPATQEQLIAEVEQRKSPDFNPLRDVQDRIRAIEKRVQTNTDRVSAINSAPMPTRRDRVAAVSESRKSASAPLNQQIKDDQQEIAALRGIERQLQEVDRPTREAYPLAGAATVIGGTLGAAALSRYGMGKVAKGINESVDAARSAGQPFNSVEFIRNAQIAGDRASAAPIKKVATALAAASIPADLQALVDASDYKGKPKWTRAYQEAERNFSDPMAYLKSLGPAFVSGIAGAAAGYKLAPQAQAEAARRFGETARSYDPRGFWARQFYGDSPAEAIAPAYAKDVARAARSDARTSQALSSARNVPSPPANLSTTIQGEVVDGQRLLPPPGGPPNLPVGGPNRRGPYPLTSDEEAELRAALVRLLSQR